MITRCGGLDPPKSRELNTPLQPKANVYPVLSGCHAHKADSNLKDDECLLGIKGHGTKSADHRAQAVEKLSDDRIFAFEVISDLVASARVPHVRGHKAVSALWASPERFPPCWHPFGDIAVIDQYFGITPRL